MAAYTPATRRMTSTRRSRSSSVMFEPEGRQRPISKPFGHAPADNGMLSEHGLEVHGLPEGPGLNVGLLEGQLTAGQTHGRRACRAGRHVLTLGFTTAHVFVIEGDL